MKRYAQIMALLLFGTMGFATVIQQVDNPRPWIIAWIIFGAVMAVLGSVALYNASSRWLKKPTR